ncbi:MAG: tRNA 2-thiocytidine(32) synthetase TtcA [Erysipelotrichaceae bacterium]|nr:tRNA 2-thiocytidine(32) synthetase TtcA [Erysipelotrichaceae bacterium]
MKCVKKVLGCLRKADNDYDLIHDGDRIAVGVSGGKDSSVLLYCLNLYRQFSHKNYELVPIYCDMGFGNRGMEEVQEYFRRCDLEVIIHSTQIAEILRLHANDEGRISCSLCSRLRKGALINAAIEHGCNKLALAHHNDDALETLFMNMIYGGRVATFQPRAFLERSGMTQIRPLIYAYEKDIARFASSLEMPISKNLCGNDGSSERQSMKDLLHGIYHKYPKARDNFELMLRNERQFALFHPLAHEDENETEINGE